MKVERLKIHNFQKISDIDLIPEGSLVVITGKNGAAKSTVLGAIMALIGGAKHLPLKPVKRGEDKALLEADLGDLNVKRTITPDGGGTLVVRNKDGVRQESPQGILDALFGMLTFDPQVFRNAAPAKRFDMLSELLGLNFEIIESEMEKVYTDRTVSNRELKSIENRVQAQVEYPDAPKEEVSAADIMAEMQKAEKSNSENNKKRQAARICEGEANRISDIAERSKKECSRIRAEIERLQKDEAEEIAEFDRLTGAAEEKLKAAKVLSESVSKLTDIDLSPFAEKVKTVEASNAKVRANRDKAELRKQLKAKSDESEALTSKIEKLEKRKREQIMAAKYPVEGLSLSDDRQVLFNGIPFDQASTGEQIRVSVAMGLAMNSKLNILLIRDGNDLDMDNLKLIGDMAEKAGAQIWLEKIRKDDVGWEVVLEEGVVKPTPPAEQKELV